MEQRDLFEPPPVWDGAAGELAKADGMEAAADSRAELLALARRLAVRVALSRPDRCVNADDVQAALGAAGFSIHALGNAAGSLFAGRAWVWTGRREKSRRRHAHANELKVWRYVGEADRE